MIGLDRKKRPFVCIKYFDKKIQKEDTLVVFQRHANCKTCWFKSDGNTISPLLQYSSTYLDGNYQKHLVKNILRLLEKQTILIYNQHPWLPDDREITEYPFMTLYDDS